MNFYQRYIKLKALADFYESLSDDDKKLFSQSLSENEKIMKKLKAVESKVEGNHHSFGFGVLENVAGNAAYDLGLWFIRKLLKR